MSADLPLIHRHEPPDGDTSAAVVLLHGRGADEADLLPVGERLPGDRHVISVRAPDRMGQGYTWYELDLSAGGLHSSQPDAADFDRSRSRLAGFLDGAVESYDLDPSRLGLLGFSQGAITGLAVALERPDRLGWCVALHGYLAGSHSDLDRFDGTAGFPVFVGAGDGDRVIPAARAREAADALAAAGLDVTFRTYPTGHGIGPDEMGDVADWVDDR